MTEAGTRQFIGYYYYYYYYLDTIKFATPFTSDMQKHAFKNNQHSNLKLDRSDQLPCKTPSYLSISP